MEQVQAGEAKSRRCYRKVIKITAECSPNVQLAMREKAAGKVPSGRMIVPGVLPWSDYVKRRATWDAVRQCIGLDAEFYEGADTLLFPSEWLNRAERIAAMLPRRTEGKAIGVDPAEGGDNTAIAVVDELGLLELRSFKTPNTVVIKGEVLATMRKWNVDPARVVFDRGGGGKQIADEIRSLPGMRKIRSIGFGESVAVEPGESTRRIGMRIDQRETRYAYANRRAQLYGELRLLLDPAAGVQPSGGDAVIDMVGTRESKGFGIPVSYLSLRQQLAPIPLMYDGEGRLRLPPKDKKSPSSTEVTLKDLIGRSPDEADALVLAIHGILHSSRRVVAGVA